MFIYYGLLLFIVLLYLFLHKSKSKNHDVLFLKIVFLVLIVIGSVRSTEVGGDLWHYLRAYERFGVEKWSDLFANRTKYGYIFAIISKLAYSIDPSPQTFLTVMSVVSLLPVYYFIKKYSVNKLMSVFIYITFGFYTNTFNSIRASIALGVGLLMMRFIIERKLWKFLIGVAIAAEIHITFIPFVFLYPLYKKKITEKYLYLSIVVCFALSQMLSLWQHIVSIGVAYDSAYSNIEKTTGGFTLLILTVGITIVFYYINRGKENEMSRLFSHCLIFACCALCFATCYTVLTRIALFFYVVLIVYFPLTISGMAKLSTRKVAGMLTYFLFFVYFVLFIMTPLKKYEDSNYQKTIPYTFCWEVENKL